MRNAPITSIKNIIVTTIGQDVIVPVTVSNFTDIRAVSLTLLYDKDVLFFKQGNNTSGFEGLGFGDNIDGVVKIGGFNNGTTLTDNSEFFNLVFTYISGTTTNLTWYNDNNASCEYAGMDLIPLLDKPTSDYYKNGSVTLSTLTPPLATINGSVNPIGLNVLVSFQIGESIEYDHNITIGTMNGSETIPVSLQLSSGEYDDTSILKPNTLYHYRITATTPTGIIIYGEDVTFNTPVYQPIVITLPATNIS